MEEKNYTSLFEVENLNEAFSRSKLMGDAISTGKVFMEHFHKIYSDRNNTAVNHWISEMKNWFDRVCSVKWNRTNRTLADEQIYSWFLTAGAGYEDFIMDADIKEVRDYEKFCELILANKTEFNKIIKEFLKL